MNLISPKQIKLYLQKGQYWYNVTLISVRLTFVAV